MLLIYLTHRYDLISASTVYRCSSRFPTPPAHHPNSLRPVHRGSQDSMDLVEFVQVWSITQRSANSQVWWHYQESAWISVLAAETTDWHSLRGHKQQSLCLEFQAIPLKASTSPCSSIHAWWSQEIEALYRLSCLLIRSHHTVILSPCLHVQCTSARWGLPVPRKWCHCGRHPSRSWGTTIMFWSVAFSRVDVADCLCIAMTNPYFI